MLKSLAIRLFVALLALATSPLLAAEDSQDGRDRPLKDPFLDGLVGDWQVSRVMKIRKAESTAQAEWVLNHQFVRLHYGDAANATNYEATVFIGHDNAAKQYVVHWIDVFGGHFSRTLGFGKRDGNALVITFDYPDGEFRNTLTFDPADRTWTSLMRQKDKNGEWSTFAEEKFRHATVK